MLGKEITLNKLIAVANGKVSSDKQTLEKMAAEARLEGTAEEIMDYVETHQALFSDSNLADVKTALSTFLRKMPPPTLRLTMAAISREIEEFKNQQNPPGTNGGKILSQDDLDALLSQIKTDSGESPTVGEISTEHDSLQPSASMNSSSEVIDQSDIDALLAGVQADVAASPQHNDIPDHELIEDEMDSSDHFINQENPAPYSINSDKEVKSDNNRPRGNLPEFIPETSGQFSESEHQGHALKPAGDISITEDSCIVVQEKGDAKILKEFYRIYVRDNGSFISFFETDSKEKAKAEFGRALAIYPANQIFLGKIVQKEVLVIKEDVRKVPVAVRVEFTE